MEEINRNTQLQKLFDILQLGRIIGNAEPIAGGLLHKMFSVETPAGKFAVKALNPQIMSRPTALQNTVNSERIAAVAAHIIPCSVAKIFGGNSIQTIDGQHYLVYDFIEGKCLGQKEISEKHCGKIGDILADLHGSDFSELNIPDDMANDEKNTDWNFYLQKGSDSNAPWHGLMQENIHKLCEWDEKSNRSASLADNDTVISHRDLDSKNVMWNGDKPVVIDWEAAGRVNRMQELIETALYWSNDEKGNICKNRFTTFIDVYKRKHISLTTDWDSVLNKGFSNKLGWLEYNLKRSLSIESSDESDRHTGTEQVGATILDLLRYDDTLTVIRDWLEKF